MTQRAVRSAVAHGSRSSRCSRPRHRRRRHLRAHHHLRNDAIPPLEHGTTLRVYVGGITAIFDDFATVIAGKLPLFIAVIIGLGFLLLLVAFRSLVVPATAAFMNLLAAGAAFGVLVVFFQWGWGAELLGLGKPGPIEAFLPVMMLAILFGLSMDYQVFLVSRMHEEWVHTGDNEHAVTSARRPPAGSSPPPPPS